MSWFRDCFTVLMLRREVFELREEVHHMALNVAGLNDAVAANTAAVNAAVAVLTSGNPADQAAVDAAASAIAANTAALTAATPKV